MDAYRFVLLNTGPVDTESAEAVLSRSAAMESFDGKRLHLVQFVGPARRNWLTAIRDTGVQVVTYLPHNSYLVYGDTASIGALRDLGSSVRFVQWDAPYRGERKINPRARAVARLRSLKGRRSGGQSDDLYAIQLVRDSVANPVTIAMARSRGRGAIRSQFGVQNYLNLIVPLRLSDLDTLAERPDVVSIQPFAVPQKSGDRHERPWEPNGLGGTGGGGEPADEQRGLAVLERNPFGTLHGGDVRAANLRDASDTWRL
jgi:hypothetical protein